MTTLSGRCFRITPRGIFKLCAPVTPSQCLESPLCHSPLLRMLQLYFLLSLNMLSSLISQGLLHLLFLLPPIISSFRLQLKHHLLSKTFSDHPSPSGKSHSYLITLFYFLFGIFFTIRNYFICLLSITPHKGSRKAEFFLIALSPVPRTEPGTW